MPASRLRSFAAHRSAFSDLNSTRSFRRAVDEGDRCLKLNLLPAGFRDDAPAESGPGRADSARAGTREDGRRLLRVVADDTEFLGLPADQRRRRRFQLRIARAIGVAPRKFQ